MAIPGYQDFMLPLLTISADHREHTLSEAMDTLAAQMGISDAERELMLPSGTQTRFYNRVTWAVTYLTKSLLLEKIGRGRFRISERGANALRDNPPRIDNSYLEQFPEYRDFKARKSPKSTETVSVAEELPSVVDSETTPEEQLQAAHEELRTALADDLLRRVRASCESAPPRAFSSPAANLPRALAARPGKRK